MRIALLANLKENAPATDTAGADLWDDLDSPETIDAILGALESAGHRAEFFEAAVLPPHNLLARLESYKPELCFNISEGHFGEGREAQVPALLETLRLPYTGSGVLALALALDKPMTKRILHYHELPTPEFQVFGRRDEEINDDLLFGDALKFPLFVKPSREGTGMGVSGQSIVSTVPELRERVAEMLETYRQPILCERFVEGREITVGLVGNLAPTAARRLNDRTAPALLPAELALLPPMEIEMEKYDESERGVYTNRIKVELVHDFHYRCPAEIDDELRERLFGLSAAVFRVTGGRDVSRVDFRIDATDGTPYVLELNPLPGLNPEYSDLCIEAYAAGWSFKELINRIVDLAAERYRIAV